MITKKNNKLHQNRPEPIITDIDVITYKRGINPEIAVDDLIDGYYVLILDSYSSGLEILNKLKKRFNNNKNQSFKEQREARSVFREISHRLLLVVNNNKLAVKNAPEIGWFKILYPEFNEFLLPFTQVQGLNSSWQWYKKGISIPNLDKKIHPYFGTYFPTRFEHIELFDDWLKLYKGEKKLAIDIGIGSGVLSFLMLKYDFEKIVGTDLNPNAIIGLSKNPNSKIDLIHGNLFANCNLKTELIVFNPPWLPASHNLDEIDKAIYYDENLFNHFFDEAKKYLKPNGKIVILFSNLAEITNISKNHPIKDELSKNKRFEKELFIQKKVSKSSNKTRRNQNWRATEMVELWVLKFI